MQNSHSNLPYQVQHQNSQVFNDVSVARNPSLMSVQDDTQNLNNNYRQNMVSPSILQESRSNSVTNFLQPSPSPVPGQMGQNLHQSQHVSGRSSITPGHPLNCNIRRTSGHSTGTPLQSPNPNSNSSLFGDNLQDQWYAQQEAMLVKNVERTQNNLRNLESSISGRDSTDDETSRLSYLKRQLESEQLQLNNHQMETRIRREAKKMQERGPELQAPVPVPVPMAMQQIAPTPVPPPPSYSSAVHQPISKPAAPNMNSQSSLITIPPTSKTVPFISDDGKVQKLIIPVGMDVEKMPNGQMMLVNSKQVMSRSPITTAAQPNLPLDTSGNFLKQPVVIAPSSVQQQTVEDTIDRISDEAKSYTNRLVNFQAQKHETVTPNLGPIPTPPIWLNRSKEDSILTATEIAKCQELQDPEDDKKSVTSEMDCVDLKDQQELENYLANLDEEESEGREPSIHSAGDSVNQGRPSSSQAIMANSGVGQNHSIGQNQKRKISNDSHQNTNKKFKQEFPQPPLAQRSHSHNPNVMIPPQMTASAGVSVPVFHNQAVSVPPSHASFKIQRMATHVQNVTNTMHRSQSLGHPSGYPNTNNRGMTSPSGQNQKTTSNSNQSVATNITNPHQNKLADQDLLELRHECEDTYTVGCLPEMDTPKNSYFQTDVIKGGDLSGKRSSFIRRKKGQRPLKDFYKNFNFNSVNDLLDTSSSSISSDSDTSQMNDQKTRIFKKPKLPHHQPVKVPKNKHESKLDLDQSSATSSGMSDIELQDIQDIQDIHVIKDSDCSLNITHSQHPEIDQEILKIEKLINCQVITEDDNFPDFSEVTVGNNYKLATLKLLENNLSSSSSFTVNKAKSSKISTNTNKELYEIDLDEELNSSKSRFSSGSSSKSGKESHMDISLPNTPASVQNLSHSSQVLSGSDLSLNASNLNLNNAKISFDDNTREIIFKFNHNDPLKVHQMVDKLDNTFKNSPGLHNRQIRHVKNDLSNQIYPYEVEGENSELGAAKIEKVYSDEKKGGFLSLFRGGFFLRNL